jgi:peptidyl-tRNA hydrolase, PTH1 family
VSDAPWLVIGLGNPGPEHAGTRHNAGRMVVERLADDLNAGALRRERRLNASVENTVATDTAGPHRMLLAEPGSYMNLSGGPVAALVGYYHVRPDHLIVVHDDLDLPFGTLRLKRGGGHGGHNGLRDIIAALKTPDFLRVRVGIDRPHTRQPVADYVLRPFTTVERRELPMLVSDAADAVQAIALDGLEAAQRRVHAPRS